MVIVSIAKENNAFKFLSTMHSVTNVKWTDLNSHRFSKTQGRGTDIGKRLSGIKWNNGQLHNYSQSTDLSKLAPNKNIESLFF